ncbi:MAG: ABC transporter substrate-binding protein [Actinobacteria bacterium]|nr:ABC transporter substrate-binding protein [Actinomycetota bacterium]
MTKKRTGRKTGLALFASFAVLLMFLTVFSMISCKTEVAAIETAAEESIETTPQSSEEKQEPEETAAETTAEIILTDGLGNEVKMVSAAEKIIVFVPSALEILSGIGAMDKVIGVDNWSIDMGDPLAEGLEGFGDFQGLNMEKIAAADPDIIIGLIGWAEEDIKKLEELGIKLYIVDANTVDEVYREILNMGALTAMTEEAQALKNELETKIDEIEVKTADLAEDEKPKVFYEVWNDPLMSAGKDTFINELIEHAGGINIVAQDGLEGWPEYSVESLIKNNPDVIIAPTSLAADASVILSDSRFSDLNAVVNERVYIVPDNPVIRPSQNISKGLMMLAQALHPDIFGEFEVQQ